LQLIPLWLLIFFDFSINCFLEHLLGWNFKSKKSTECGGLFGNLRAYYGTSEYTERGCLHGHFVIWLDGGLNPNEVHHKLSSDKDFEQCFFSFFEQIIRHDLPDVDYDIDLTFEPRTQRPPHVDIEDWQNVFVAEVKSCGEVLQRHVCKSVCHKYNNENKCRFLFPHEVVDASYFDKESNSVVLMCRDGTVNYYNPYILVFCRHNHDVKCILSGKAAKAAIFYITDYITKLDVKTYEMLSLMSKAVAAIPENSALPQKDAAKMLLHKCLSQFTRQQQILYMRSKQPIIFVDTQTQFPHILQFPCFLVFSCHILKKLDLVFVALTMRMPPSNTHVCVYELMKRVIFHRQISCRTIYIETICFQTSVFMTLLDASGLKENASHQSFTAVQLILKYSTGINSRILMF
jgi:hypothetical protein